MEKANLRCDICDKTFKGRNTLSNIENFKAHIEIHSKGRLICDICSKTYPSIKTLENHFNRFHLQLSVIDPQDLENDLNLETPWPKKIIIEASGPKNYEEILKDIRSPPNWRDGQSWSNSSIKEILLNVKDNLKNLYRVITSADDLYLMEVEPADADEDGKS